MPDNDEATFTYGSAERIAETVKAYERGRTTSEQDRRGNDGRTGVANRNVKVSGAYNATRKQYPGKYQYATVDGSKVIVWNNLSTETQDCWLDGDSTSELTVGAVYVGLLTFMDNEDNTQLPIYKAVGSVSLSGLVDDVTCDGGELVVHKVP